MTVKIGDKTLPTVVDDKSKAALEDATGCSIGEIVSSLARSRHTAHVSRVLHPLLKEPVPLADLALLVDADPVGVSEQVAKLLAPAQTQGKSA